MLNLGPGEYKRRRLEFGVAMSATNERKREGEWNEEGPYPEHELGVTSSLKTIGFSRGS
jgi:hypothetical protein